MWDVKMVVGKVLDRNTGKGFTLTMWDVKYIGVYTSNLYKMFYLNYVGCKECRPSRYFA